MFGRQLLSHKLSTVQVVGKRGSWHLDELRASRPHLLVAFLVRSTAAEGWLGPYPPASSSCPPKGYLTRSSLDRYESIERLTPATLIPKTFLSLLTCRSDPTPSSQFNNPGDFPEPTASRPSLGHLLIGRVAHGSVRPTA